MQLIFYKNQEKLIPKKNLHHIYRFKCAEQEIQKFSLTFYVIYKLNTNVAFI